MISEILLIIFYTVILCAGATIATGDDMLAEDVMRYAKSKKAKIWKAIIICPWCMPSLWSFFGYTFYWLLEDKDITWRLIAAYPICVCGSSLFHGLIWGLSGFLNGNKEDGDRPKSED